MAEEKVEPVQAELPHKVSNVTIKTLRGEVADLPYFGEKNLFMFYIDPDTGLTGNKNYKYSDVLEEKGVTNGPNMYGFGVLNLKDTALPKSIVRSMARHRTAKNNGFVMDDSNHVIRDAWQLGDCNNKFCFMIVTKEGELVFFQKEEMDKQAQVEFLDWVQQYR
ncbi:MAG: hypothetical protein II281_02815 [Alistipes sp.]|nr:hypothetical protein [Alistipes sp.]